MNDNPITLPAYEEFHTLFTKALLANDPDNTLSAYCTEDISRAFYRLTEEMLRTNAHMNITAITDIPGILIKHYADCAMIAPMIPQNAHLCDVGCGGGFPSLPIAILRRDVRITAVDSTQKKLDYVRNTAVLLGLSNLTTKAARAEELGKNDLFRENFDFVTARAVARMNVLCEWCLPLTKPGGTFLAMKGRGGAAEHDEAKHAISVLGGKTFSVREIVLCDPFCADADEDAMRRCLISVKKETSTPKQYPRANAQIAKKPL